MPDSYGSLPSDRFSFIDLPVEQAARRLLGCELVRTVGDRLLRVRIVETEAYDQDDPASHAHRGMTKRNRAMFASAGHLYVYQIHGIHFCCNVVTGKAGYGSGALIRAVEPLEGQPYMEARRKRGGVEVTNGPGKVCQALAIDTSLTGHDLLLPPLQLIEREPVLPESILSSPRVGISQAKDALRRYFLQGNPYVSRRSGAQDDRAKLS